MTSFHMICSLGLPQSKILGKPINRKSSEKNFWKPYFLENACACVLGPWSLASSIPVLGLESACTRKGCPWPCPWPRIFLCPWPWPRALCPRLHLWSQQLQDYTCRVLLLTAQQPIEKSFGWRLNWKKSLFCFCYFTMQQKIYSILIKLKLTDHSEHSDANMVAQIDFNALKI